VIRTDDVVRFELDAVDPDGEDLQARQVALGQFL
jgi:hypothetical protein